MGRMPMPPRALWFGSAYCAVGGRLLPSGVMSEPRLHISKRLSDMMSYDKMSGEVPRLLILRGEYWLDGACENAARAMGWQVEPVPVVMEGVLSKEQIARLLETLVTQKPDFILSINLSGMDLGGLLARLFEDLGVPYVTWFVDDPRTIVMGRSTFATGNSIALTWDKAYTAYLQQAGFPAVHTLPLATDPTLFHGAPATQWPYPPTFVGNSMEEFAERSWTGIQANTRLVDALNTAFEAGRVTRENFGSGLDTILEAGYCASLDAEEHRSAEMLCFIEGTRRLRRAHVEALLPEGLTLRGDAGWQRYVPNAQGPVNYFQDLPGFYRNCEINFNVTSIQMPHTVNQRAFDCPAAGGFLLTDAQSDLAELFDAERETATYATTEECVDKFRWYRAHPEARVAIVQAAQRRILAEHTYAHRLRSIARLVMERFG